MRNSPATARSAAPGVAGPAAALAVAALGAVLALCPIAAVEAMAADRAEQQATLEVSPAGRDLFTVEPRRTVTGIFAISNHAFRELDLKSRLDVPAGWSLVATDLAERMYGEDRATSLVSLHVPRTTRAGRYRITYAVRADQDPAMEDSCAIEVEVLPVVRLILRPIETPRYVIAGDLCEAYFALTNQGNTTAAVSLRTETAGDVGLSAEPAGLELATGETRRVRLLMASDPGARRRIVERVTLVAETGDPRERVRSTIPVDVIPRISIIEDAYYRTPAQVTVRYVGEGDGIDKSLLQAEITGGGPIDDTGERHTSFHIIGPDSRGKGTLGKPDEYFFSYRAGRYEASLGDQSFSVSQLLEPGRYGFGASAAVEAGNLRVGTYHMQTRWDQPRTEESAATLDCTLGESGALGINYLTGNAPSRSHVLGLEGRVKPVDGADIEVEYCRGLGGEAAGQAYRLYTRAAAGSVQLLLRLARADADFPGYYADINYIASTLTFNPARDLRLGLGLREESHNLDLDPDSGSAPRDRSLDVNADYRLHSAADFFLGYRFTRHGDRADRSAYRTDESSARSSVTYRARRWDAHAGVETGGTRDLITGRWGALSRYTLLVSVRPSGRQAYRGYLFTDSNSLDQGSHHATAGASASLRLSERTALDAGIKADHFGAAGHDRAVFTAGLTRTMPRGATGRLEAYYGTCDSEAPSDRFGVLCEVDLPIGVPLARRPNVGSLRGLVYDAETGAPVPDVILRLNGVTAVTGDDGRYAFPSLKAGGYALGIDRGTIGLARTAVVPLPIDVKVAAGGEAVVDIGVSRSSSLRGEIGLFAFARKRAGLLEATDETAAETAAELVSDGGLAGAVVELAGAGETRYGITDDAGGFEFADLRPGKWRLTVRTEDLPENTYLEADGFEFELKPGEPASAHIRVLPRHRQIRMRGSGGMIEETSL